MRKFEEEHINLAEGLILEPTEGLKLEPTESEKPKEECPNKLICSTLFVDTHEEVCLTKSYDNVEVYYHNSKNPTFDGIIVFRSHDDAWDKYQEIVALMGQERTFEIMKHFRLSKKKAI